MAGHSRPIGGVQWCRIVVYQRGDMKESSNDFWFSITTGTISPSFDFQTATQDIFHALVNNWKTALSLEYVIRGCYAEFNDGVGTTTTDFYEETDGTASDNALPQDVALVVRKRTSNTTRSGKGRWYVAGITLSQTDGSYLNTAGVAAWTPVAVDWKTAVTTGGVEFSPAHFSAKTGHLYAIVDDPLIALLGTRRRRRGPF